MQIIPASITPTRTVMIMTVGDDIGDNDDGDDNDDNYYGDNNGDNGLSGTG